jgi:hypothetical protein
MMGLSAVHMLIFGMNELENEFKSSVYSEPTSTPRVAYTDHSEPAAPRFEPPKAPPTA